MKLWQNNINVVLNLLTENIKTAETTKHKLSGQFKSLWLLLLQNALKKWVNKICLILLSTAVNGTTPGGRQTDISPLSEPAIRRVVWLVLGAISCWHKCWFLSSWSADSPALYFKADYHCYIVYNVCHWGTVFCCHYITIYTLLSKRQHVSYDGKSCSVLCCVWQFCIHVWQVLKCLS